MVFMKAGFIGLGVLGKTIAKRLISEGVDLVVWNRTKEKALNLGVEIAQTPAQRGCSKNPSLGRPPSG